MSHRVIFTAEEVRAYMAGRKTQFRRLIGPYDGIWSIESDDDGVFWPGGEDEMGDWQKFPCPFGEPGERLWVAETWKASGNCYRRAFGPQIRYRADDVMEWRPPRVEGVNAFASDAALRDWLTGKCSNWQSSTTMPQWASRLKIEVTEVRVEQSRDINWEGSRYREGEPRPYLDLDANPWLWAVTVKPYEEGKS